MMLMGDNGSSGLEFRKVSSEGSKIYENAFRRVPINRVFTAAIRFFRQKKKVGPLSLSKKEKWVNN